MASLGKLTHELVHRLSSREKAHFRKMYKANHADSKRMRLFGWLNASREYDNETLRDFCSREGIHAGTTLNALRQSILRSLRIFTTGRSQTLQLNEILAEVEVLYLKGLFELANRQISIGIRLADEVDRPAYSMQFREWQMRCAFAENAQRIDPKMINSQMALIDRFAKEHLQTLSINHLAYLMDANLRDPDQSTATLRRTLREQILQHEFIRDAKAFSSTRVRAAYHDLVASIYFYLEEWDECLKHSEALYGILAQSATPYRLTMLLTNLMTICNLTGDSSRFRNLEQEFEEVSARETTSKDADLINRVCRPRADIQRLRQQLTLDDSRSLKTLLKRVEAYLPEADETSAIGIYLALIHFHFQGSDFERAAAYCFDARQHCDLSIEPETAYLILWMELLSLYFIKDTRLFESRLRSMSSQFREGKGRHYKSERIMLAALRRSFGKLSRDRRTSLHQAYNKILPDLDHIRWPAREFDLIGWWETQTRA